MIDMEMCIHTVNKMAITGLGHGDQFYTHPLAMHLYPPGTEQQKKTFESHD
jgi:hypothetical protein